MDFDAIVVGARCAGAPTAMLLASAGYRVLMLERATFPRDTLSTLYIHRPGIDLLRRWGVLDRVAGTGCPPITQAVHQLGDVRIEGPSPLAYAPRRILLDAILADAAVAAGVEFRPGCTVQEVLFSEGSATGVRFRAGGATVTASAPLIIGADGMRSRVAACVGAETQTEVAPLTCVYFTFFAEVPAGFEAYGTTGRWAGSVPTNDGLTLAATYFPQDEFRAIRSDLRAAYRDCLRTVAPDLHERISAGRPADDRLYGSADQRNFLRRASGPGWALVGDAGHHKDSITARGITDAFLQAQALVDALSDGLRDGTRRQRALDTYAKRRDALVLEPYRDTLTVAGLRPLARIRQMRAIAADPARIERFFAAAAGVAGDPEPQAAVRPRIASAAG
ncbi:NAD(P)/FAD-dependent oxidoreductase [Mangrovihabitans endophyticus]|uniref:FAD-dependent oxidoreductase n=1 Tax=Mangrovihabitans endophyticus TaxID=1751298 RepID=A0A8J3BW94_9ACTN|nr:NAD(P)/FAD-dependent oxidoreductase [Mangrovihabitans endophyticus]GGK75992.1 FAD-dependent oxidoreductase [Mangrovihabitans endophyticus]